MLRLLLATVLPLAAALSWSYDDYPSLSGGGCNKPSESSTLCDPDSILTLEQAKALQNILGQSRTVACPCSAELCASSDHGYVVGLAVLEKMDIDRSYAGELSESEMRLNAAMNLAGQLHASTWRNLGRCGEDVIVVYSKNDGVVYIMTSRLARQRLSDMTVGQIIRDSAMAFANGANPFRGLERVLKQVRDAMLDDYQPHRYANLRSG